MYFETTPNGSVTSVIRQTISSTGFVGIGTTSPTNLLSLGGDTARTIWMERSATAATTGNSLTLQAGGTKSGNTDQNGGDLILSSGTATGTGSSNITFKTAAAGTTGTTDRSPATALTVFGSGNVSIGSSSATSSRLYVADTAGAPLYISSTAGYADMRFQNSVSSQGYFEYAGNDFKLYANSSSVPTMTIKGGAPGNVGIGTTGPNTALDVAGAMSVRGMAAPALSPTGQGRIYFDSTSSTFKVSENGGAYANLVGGGGSISADSLDFTEFKDAMTLDASTDIAASGTDVFSITNTGTGNSFLVNDAASDTTPFVIDAAGDVGIGTTSPANKLDVQGGLTLRSSSSAFAAFSYAPNTLSITSNGGQIAQWSNGSLTLGQWPSNQTIKVASGGGGNTNRAAANLTIGSGESTGNGAAAGIVFKYAPTGASGTQENALAEGFRLDGSGNVGIGTTSPITKLDFGTSVANAGQILNLYTNANRRMGIGMDAASSAMKLYSSTDDTKALSVGTISATDGTTFSEKFTVLTNGNVGIGTTSPAYKLHVVGSQASGWIATVYNSATSGNAHGFNAQTADPSGVSIMGYNTSTAAYGYLGYATYGVYCNGAVCGGTQVWSNVSDARLKTNIENLENSAGLDAVMKLRPVTFDWRDRKLNKTNGKQLGFIAQEVEKVLPELVEHPGTPTTVQLDGGHVETVADTLTMSYATVVVPLVKAVQELKVENDDLRREFDAYKAEHP